MSAAVAAASGGGSAGGAGQQTSMHCRRTRGERRQAASQIRRSTHSPWALLAVLLCSSSCDATASAGMRTKNGCECLQYTSTEAGEVFEGCHPSQNFCDVAPGCDGAKDADAILNYGGWDECSVASDSTAAPSSPPVDASQLQNLAQMPRSAAEGSAKDSAGGQGAAGAAAQRALDSLKVSQQGRVISVEGADIETSLRYLLAQVLQDEHSGEAHTMFASLDVDGDGTLIQQEVNKLVPMDDLLADIKKLKAASNGGSSDGTDMKRVKEQAIASAIRRSKIFKLLDTNNDQKISQEEFASGAQPQPQHDDL